MAVQRWRVLDGGGNPVNVVLWDPDAAPDWTPPAGHTVVPDDGTPLTLECATPLTPEEKLAAASAALAAVQTLTAPVLAADVLDVLVNLKTALEG